MGVLQLHSRDSNRLRQRPNSVEDVGFKNATFNEIDHSVVYQHDHHHRGGDGAVEEGVGERCINETSLITGAVIFLIAQVRASMQLMVWLTNAAIVIVLFSTAMHAGLPPAAVDVSMEEEEECHGQGGRRLRPRDREQLHGQPLLHLRRGHSQANELSPPLRNHHPNEAGAACSFAKEAAHHEDNQRTDPLEPKPKKALLKRIRPKNVMVLSRFCDGRTRCTVLFLPSVSVV